MVGGDASTRPKPSYPDVVHRDEQHHPQHHDHNGGEPYQTVFHDDYNLFMDDLGPTPHLLPPHFDTDQPATAAGSRRPSYSAAAFPSLGPDIDQQDARVNGTGGAGPKSWLRMSIADHNTIKNRLDDFSAVLPRDFVFPSRHTLTRFLEGYASGFHEHVPFLHLPTFSPADAAPELLLAVLAVGAQYRFESNRGYALWYASRAVAAEQVRRRRSGDMSALLPTLAAYSPHSTRPSPSATYRHSFASAQSERPTVQEAHREP